MTSFMQWLAMGGYSFYVWPAYGFVGVVLLMNIWGIRRQQKRIRIALQQWFKRQL